MTKWLKDGDDVYINLDHVIKMYENQYYQVLLFMVDKSVQTINCKSSKEAKKFMKDLTELKKV